MIPTAVLTSSSWLQPGEVSFLVHPKGESLGLLSSVNVNVKKGVKL
jgi:hypothetical protein